MAEIKLRELEEKPSTVPVGPTAAVATSAVLAGGVVAAVLLGNRENNPRMPSSPLGPKEY